MTDSRACPCRCATEPVARSTLGLAFDRLRASQAPSSPSGCGKTRFRSCDRISALISNGGATVVVQDRAYTTAPREFGGLGKRKRTERLAQIEMLYDRHVIGPAVLDAAPAPSSPSDGVHREVRGHWRRPHFKMQPHGPQRSLRKLVFIGPTDLPWNFRTS